MRKMTKSTFAPSHESAATPTESKQGTEQERSRGSDGKS